MSAADVLAVMNRAAIRLDNGHGIESMNLAIEVSEARAAVAELIEAMTAERLARDTSAPVSQLVAAIERTDAALARVGGGK